LSVSVFTAKQKPQNPFRILELHCNDNKNLIKTPYTLPDIHKKSKNILWASEILGGRPANCRRFKFPFLNVEGAG